jgi:hypothetical protein
VTTATDAQHCGGCGRACATGQSCVDSQCAAAACTAGQTLCGGACVDTRIDPQHCGACGVACGAGRNCVAGQCTCPPGRTDCTAACVALATDPSNCGACGRSCGAGTCTNGACTCPSSQQLCAGSCVPTASDAANCGSCGRACAMGQVCSNGACACPAGQTLCQGQCLPTASDNLNCGGCGTVCPSGRFCSAGQCVQPFTCQTNFNMPPMDCGQLPIDLMRCGVSTLASTAGPFTGTLVNATDVFSYALSPQPAERYRITASLLGTSGSSSSYRLSLLNDAGTELVGRSSVATNSSVEVETIDVSGSLGDCLQPAAVRLNRTFNSISYTVTVDRFTTNGRNNLGSTSLSTPTPLLSNPAGRTCDQVCGTLSTSCGGVRQHFAVVIPPRKAAIFEYAMRGGSSSGTIYNLTAYQPSGVVICDLVRNQLISTMWEVATARLVNNTSSPQTVIVQPNITTGNGLTNLFQLSVAVEP